MKELYQMTNKQLISHAEDFVKRDNSEIRDIVFELTARLAARDARIKKMEELFGVDKEIDDD